MRFILSILAFLLFLGCKSNLIGISENKNSKKYQKTIKFEIFIDNQPFAGVSIKAFNSKYVTTDFDGKANLFINYITEKVELSYMGKPTFVKIIKNCDFIKVDLS